MRSLHTVKLVRSLVLFGFLRCRIMIGIEDACFWACDSDEESMNESEERYCASSYQNNVSTRPSVRRSCSLSSGTPIAIRQSDRSRHDSIRDGSCGGDDEEVWDEQLGPLNFRRSLRFERDGARRHSSRRGAWEFELEEHVASNVNLADD